MKIAVCEDDAFEMKMICKNLESALRNLPKKAELACFFNGEELLGTIRAGEIYQLYLLDIMLEEGRDGIEIAKEICALDVNPQIAFLTSSREYAVEAFSVGAIHYLVKPVTEQAVQAILGRWQISPAQEECLKVQSGREIRKFPKSQILYIKSRDRGVEIHMENRRWNSWVRAPFHILEKELEPEVAFVKIARGCIVNFKYVRRFDGAECFLINGEGLSVSRREHSKVVNRYNDFLFWKMKQEGNDCVRTAGNVPGRYC